MATRKASKAVAALHPPGREGDHVGRIAAGSSELTHQGLTAQLCQEPLDGRLQLAIVAG